MTPRGQEVLHEIVEAYIATGEAVSSRSIAQRFREGLSAASIRNVMMDLDEEGYLEPTAHLGGPRPDRKSVPRLRAVAGDSPLSSSAEIERLRAEFGRLDTMEARIEYTSRMLTKLTQGVGIAATIPRTNPALDQIELVALPDRRVLMVVMTRDDQPGPQSRGDAG